MIIKFNRNNFYEFKKINLKSLISKNSMLNNSIINNNFKINEISTLNNIRNNSLLFLSKKHQNKLNQFLNNKSVHIITDSINLNNKKLNSYSVVDNLKIAYNSIINSIITHPDHILYKDKFIKKNNSFISSYCKIHKSVKIGNNCTIGKGVKIEKNSIIKDNVVIKNSIIGQGCIIHENSVIGSSGFGFDLENITATRNEPQIGIVQIGNNCSIGSCSTIDRGKIDATIIGDSCMFDNQVHIAHNVTLGNNVIIAGQSGIAGSTTLGNNVIMGVSQEFLDILKLAIML
ncbi:MAG: UDP-3-O-(3-hydroxymyristoyl)glucosamine N-acyltransferase [Pelagibacteraceae bacterium]|nr:UDP-3-O-(3-hydroxymyristoyl)glucosamine N-acyltransferase [Pelagibacteraceae bacterium]